MLWDRREGSSLLLLCTDKFLICEVWALWEAVVFLTAGCGARGGECSKFQDLFLTSSGYLFSQLCDSGKPIITNKWLVFLCLLNLVYLSSQERSTHIWCPVKPSAPPLSCYAVLLLEQFHLNFFIYNTVKLRTSYINNRQQLLDCYASLLLIFDHSLSCEGNRSRHLLWTSLRTCHQRLHNEKIHNFKCNQPDADLQRKGKLSKWKQAN